MHHFQDIPHAFSGLGKHWGVPSLPQKPCGIQRNLASGTRDNAGTFPLEVIPGMKASAAGHN